MFSNTNVTWFQTIYILSSVLCFFIYRVEFIISVQFKHKGDTLRIKSIYLRSICCIKFTLNRFKYGIPSL